MRSRVLFSRKDDAGANIARILEEEFSLSPIGLEDSSLYVDELPFPLGKEDLLIVASRHKSESGTPSLTVHSPGNFGEAGAGGKSRQLAYAPALYLSSALHKLREKTVPGYEACLEVTHHGPTSLSAQILFVEVGSTEKEWRDLGACRAAAETISFVSSNEPRKLPSAIGFGGGHYCRKFSYVEDYALGHICPKYALKDLDAEMLGEMMEKTVPFPRIALVEKKGLGQFREKTIALLEETGLEMIQI